MPQAAPMSPALLRLVRCYENLAPATLTTELAAVYASQAHSRDPFNDVRGLPAILVIFDDMFHRTHAPRFVITGHVEQGNQAFLTWDFHFGLGRAGAGSAAVVRTAAAGVRAGRSTGDRHARLAQWVRRGQQRGSGGLIGLRCCPTPGAVRPGG